MRKAATKALYLFLCSILGMVLFAMLHRAIFVLYDLALMLDFETYSLGMSEAMILTVDFFTMLAALFFGGWYGTLLGIDWYSAVYGPNAETKAGLFHGFVPHNWRDGKKQQNQPVAATASASVKTKAAVKPVSKSKAVVEAAPKPEVSAPVANTSTWSFDDFLKATPAPKKRAVAKRATAAKSSKPKTARKTAAKKTAKIIAD